MTVEDALAFLGLPVTAESTLIRATLFYRYEQVLQAIHRQDPGWLEQLQHLQTTREALMTLGDLELQSAPHRLATPQLPDHIFVLLYSQDGKETIHTLRFPHQDWVLCFENEFAARRFSRQLGQRHLVQPWVERFETEHISKFSEEFGYGVLFIPSHQQVIPPLGTVATLQQSD